jgi:hypothetical protein
MGDKNREEVVTRGDRERTNKRIFWWIVFGLIGIVGLGSMLFGDAEAGVRCDRHLINTGESMDSVIEACGEPERRARLVDDNGNTIGTVLLGPANDSVGHLKLHT